MAKSEFSEVRRALKASRAAFLMTGVFSFFSTLFALAAALYALQVVDRVLAIRSASTLVALTAMAGGLLLVMGLLDGVRSRVLVRIGAGIDARLDERVFSASFARGLGGAHPGRSEALRDLDALRQFLTGAGLLALFDATWAPVTLLVVFLLHPVLGWIAGIGAALAFSVALANAMLTRQPLGRAAREVAAANDFAEASLRNAEVLQAMGIVTAIRERWLRQRRRGLALQSLAGDRAGALGAASRALPVLLQVAILGAGAVLAIQQDVSAGTLIAAWILAGRAVAPAEPALAHWRELVAARCASGRLDALLQQDGTRPHAKLSRPAGRLAVKDLVALPPGTLKPVLSGISFSLEPGEVLCVIGPSAAGKTTLARHLVGVWPPAGGAVRLDGVDLRDWQREELGPHLGYLPQDVELLDGSVAENIARFSERASAEEIVGAATRAGVHDMILGLPKAYDTPIGAGGNALAGGHRQRIALARALYGDPALVVLDEPHSQLDAEGEKALTGAILDLKRRGKTVVVMAHRPNTAFAADKLLVLSGGRVKAFGAKEELFATRPRVSRVSRSRNLSGASLPGES